MLLIQGLQFHQIHQKETVPKIFIVLFIINWYRYSGATYTVLRAWGKQTISWTNNLCRWIGIWNAITESPVIEITRGISSLCIIFSECWYICRSWTIRHRVGMMRQRLRKKHHWTIGRKYLPKVPSSMVYLISERISVQVPLTYTYLLLRNCIENVLESQKLTPKRRKHAHSRENLQPRCQ